MPRAPSCSSKTTRRRHYLLVEETSGLFPRVQTTPRLPLVPYVTGNQFSSFRTSTYYCCTDTRSSYRTYHAVVYRFTQRKQGLSCVSSELFPWSCGFFLGSGILLELLPKRVTRYRIHHSICVFYQQSKRACLDPVRFITSYHKDKIFWQSLSTKHRTKYLPGNSVRPCGTGRNGTKLFMAVRWVRPGTKRGKIWYFYKILKDVSCEYDRWVVETQLCELRDTSDTLIGRACAMLPFLNDGVCELSLRYACWYCDGL